MTAHALRALLLVSLLAAAGCLEDDATQLAQIDLTLRPREVHARIGAAFMVRLDNRCSSCGDDVTATGDYNVYLRLPPFVALGGVTAIDPGEVLEVITSAGMERVTFAAGSPNDAVLRLRCLGPGTGVIAAALHAGSDAASLTIRCDATGAPRELANGVAELGQVQRLNNAWLLGGGGVAANLGERPPELAAQFEAIGTACEHYTGTTSFPSVSGPATLTAQTSLQTGTATFDAGQSRYVWSGLAQGPLFGAADSVAFTWGTGQVIVPAPPPFDDASRVLSDPDGERTTFSIPDGSALVITLFGQLETGAGFSCRFPAADLPLVDGRRTLPLVPDEVAAVLPGVAARLQNVFVAQGNAAPTTALFAGEDRALDAARMLRIPAAALTP